MLRDVSHFEYVQLRRDKCRKEESVDLVAVSTLRTVVFTHLPSLKGSEVAVLFYLLGATVLRSQAAREIAIQEFCKGLQSIDGTRLDSGTGLSKPTVLSSLRSLCDRNFIHMYRLEERNGWEVSPRIYEINFKLLGAGGVKNFDPPLKNFTPLHTSNVVTTCSGNRDTSISFLPGSSLARENQVQGVSGMAFVGKKKEAKPRPQLGYSSAAEAISTITAKHAKTREQRVASATSKAPSLLTKDEMQALFDKQGAGAGLTYRLMVTQREHGFLKKRLASNPPADFADFVRWCLTYWATIAKQNHVATRKDKDRLVIGKSMPESPHFNTFTYWYPYLFRAYQNSKAATDWKPEMEKGTAESSTRIKELERRVLVAEQGAAALRKKIATAPVAPVVPAGPLRFLKRRIPGVTKPQDDLHSPVEFKDWDSVKRK